MISYLQIIRKAFQLPILFCLAIAFISGSIIGIGGQFGAIVVLGVVSLLYGILFLAYHNTKNTLWIFLLIWLPLFIDPFVLRVAKIDLFPIWQVLLMLLPFLGMASFWKILGKDNGLKIWLFFSVMFLSIGMISSIFGRSSTMAGIYQIVSDLKPMLLILFGFALRKDPLIEKVLWMSVRWLWLPMVFFIAWEWVSPNTYFSLLPGGPKYSDPSPLSFIPSRAFGFFEHPSMLASYAAILCMLSAGAAIKNIDKKKNLLLSVAYILIIICSTQRQELFGLMISIYIMYIIASKPKLLFRRLIFSTCIAMVVLLLFISVNLENLENEMVSWGVDSTEKIESPRSQLLTGAISVADNYFPLGSGFGTYGGAGSKKFDWSLYDDLGFGRYWWYGKRDYLMDTYWPNPLAETGYLGALMLLASYLMLFIIPWRKARAAIHADLPTAYYIEAAAMIIYLLQLSISSPAFQDPRLFVFPVMLIGYSLITSAGERANESN